MATRKKYRITREQVESWLPKMTDRTAQCIRWIHTYAESHDLTNEEIGARLKQPNGQPYSADSVYQSLTGRRSEAQLSRILDSIEILKKVESERSTITRAGFVETNLTKKIFKICDASRNFGKVMFLIGRSHIGKTTALREYARRNGGGNTVYLRAPAGGAKGRTTQLLCQSLNLSTGGGEFAREQAIIDALDERSVLLVDEAHQFLSGKVGLRTIEFIRELHDLSGCGIVISATEVFEVALNDDPATRKLLGQLKMRSLIQSKLPDLPTRANLNDFARHFGLTPASNEALDLQTQIIRTDSLGRWLSIMEGASRFAAKSNQQMDWTHVLKSHAALMQLERG